MASIDEILKKSRFKTEIEEARRIQSEKQTRKKEPESDQREAPTEFKKRRPWLADAKELSGEIRVTQGDLTPSMKEPAKAKQTEVTQADLSAAETEKPQFNRVQDDLGVSSPLVSRHVGVSSPLVSRHVGVSSPLETSRRDDPSEYLGVSSPLATALAMPLVSRHVGVSSPLVESVLVGAEKSLVVWVAEECRRLGSLQTNPVSTDDLRKLFSLDGSALRNLIHRVKIKGFIEVEARQLGRNGLRRFKISQKIYQEFSAQALVSRHVGVSSPLATALATPLVSPPVVVVSSSDSEILNYNYDDDLRIPKSLTEIGLSRRHLLKSKLTQDEMQSSLEAFAFDLEAGAVKPKRTTPLGFLIGVVVNRSEPYTSTQYLEAQAKDLNEYLGLKKAAEEREATQIDLERAIAFEKWIQTATDEEQAQIVKPTEYFPAGSVIYRNVLKAKFLETQNGALKSS